MRQSTECRISGFSTCKGGLRILRSILVSGHVFRPLVSASHLFFASPEEYMICIFWEMTSGIIHVFSTVWFDSGYMSLSGYEAFGRISYVLHVKWTLGDDVGLSPYSAAWFNSGYMHCVSLLRLGIFTEFLREGGLGP